MATYLCVKASNQNKTFTAKESAVKPYLCVKANNSIGYFPLTTETNTGTKLKVKANNGNTYRIVETYTTTRQITITTATSPLTKASTSGTTAYTRVSTSGTTNYTRVSTSGTTKYTRVSTSGTTNYTRVSTSGTTNYTRASTSATAPLVSSKTSTYTVNRVVINNKISKGKASITFAAGTTFSYTFNVGGGNVTGTNTQVSIDLGKGSVTYNLLYENYCSYIYNSNLSVYTYVTQNYKVGNTTNNFYVDATQLNPNAQGQQTQTQKFTLYPIRVIYSTTGTTYYTRSSTSATGPLTRSSTSATAPLTRSSTSATAPLTRSSTSATAPLTRSSTSATAPLTRSSTSGTSYHTTTSQETYITQ